MTDHASPASRSPQALAEYAAGLQAYRDGAYLLAVRKLEDAAKLDPGLAAAQLRLAAWHIADDVTSARRSLEAAKSSRASLGERDRALFDGLEVCLAEDPMPFAACSERVRGWQERFPEDAEVQLLSAVVLMVFDAETAAHSCERAVALDPAFGLAWGQLGWMREYVGHSGDASYDRCLAVSSTATNCLTVRAYARAERGNCSGLTADAQRMTSSDLRAGLGYHLLAEGLASTGAPLAAVEEALRQKASRATFDARLGTSNRDTIDVQDRVSLELLRGDLSAAIRTAKGIDVLEDVGEVEHSFAARTQIEALLELGDDHEASQAARRFDERRAAWTPDPQVDDFAMARDPTPLTLLARRRAGTLGVSEFRERRDAWLAAWRRRASPYWSRWLWPIGHAPLVETPEEAREALAALATSGPLPTFMPNTLAPAYVGRVYLLADRDEEALPFLQKAIRSCYALQSPIEHTRAHLWLGQALEKNGDTEGACRAYQVVLDRWGERARRSRTLAAARARVVALACANRR